MARNFSASGEWTFDSGTSLTTGFHLLHAYTLALLERVFLLEAESFVGLAVLVSVLWVSVSAVLAMVLTWRTKQVIPLVVLTLLMLSRNVWLNAVSGTEWSLVLLVSVLYCLAIIRSGKWKRSRSFLLIALLGCLGSLARSDFGLLPAAIAGAAGLEFLIYRRRDLAVVALVGLAGAIGGVGLVLLHNHATTGDWSSSRAAMKLSWLEVYGRSADGILEKLSQLFTGELGSKRNLLSGLSILMLSIGGCAYYRPKNMLPRLALTALKHDYSALRVLWLASAVATVGYISFYSYVPAGVQNWYTANLVVPVFFLIALPFVSHRVPTFLKGIVFVLLAILGERQVRTALQFSEAPEWPNQVSMMHAGKYLADADLAAKVGSWNAGIVGYYAGGKLINLDGLVNQDIHAFVARGELVSYVDSVGIGFIVDFERMFAADDLAKRGGYADGRLVSRLTPLMSFDEREGRWKHLTLYRVEPK